MQRLKVYGEHEPKTIEQLHRCMEHESAIAGVLCADGHLGYSQPVGAAIAYEKHISISGVGYDQACGNFAVKLDLPYTHIKDDVAKIGQDISTRISFGIGRVNGARVDSDIFDYDDLWQDAGANDLKQKARDQLGTVGSGNHYVDLFEDRDDGNVWIGVHFGSRGLGHTLTTRYLKLAGGKDGIDVPPTLVHEDSDLGRSYTRALELTSMYTYEGRRWVVEQVSDILGCSDRLVSAHNHHNWSWKEMVDGIYCNVIRKGCTPIYVNDYSFVGGSMGDDAVILCAKEHTGDDSPTLNSTVHGAGRVMGRKEAKRVFNRVDMDNWLREKGVHLIGGDLDESPMAYRRLDEVLKNHDDIRVVYRLRPFLVLMAGSDVFDPFKD